MTARTTRPGLRLLVIVSGDYGELGGAIYFLQGLGLTAPPTVLIPESLSHALSDRDDMSVHSYRGYADIQRHVDAAPVDAVMLFSGYLLDIGRRFSLVNSLRLLHLLRRRSLPVLTSDPFIGLIDSPAALDFSCVLGPEGSRLARRLRSWHLGLRLYALRLRLRHCWHIYPSPIHRLYAADARPLALSYFNGTVSEEPAREPAARPSWIFVLSDIDCRMQMRGGAEHFLAALADRLRETVELGRHAVVVAPAAQLDEMLRRLGPCPDVSLVRGAGYAEFMRLLMDAEYAFYWNYYSFSIIHRVASQLPVMFFEEGHMVHILHGLREAGIRLFYDGWRPPLLQLDARLDPDDLAVRAGEARNQFHRIVQGLRQCDPPAELLRQALSADQGNVLDAQA